MVDGADFFNLCLNANAPLIAVENPLMHKYAKELVESDMAFSVQPYQFGHGEVKRTGFWTKGLPNLIPTHKHPGREQRMFNMIPGGERQTERSRTYTGIAEAIAIQWANPALLEWALTMQETDSKLL